MRPDVLLRSRLSEIINTNGQYLELLANRFLKIKDKEKLSRSGMLTQLRVIGQLRKATLLLFQSDDKLQRGYDST